MPNKKKIIRLTEGDLHNVINECVRQCLREYFESGLLKRLADEHGGIKKRGQRSIFANDHERQDAAIEWLVQHGKASVGEFEGLPYDDEYEEDDDEFDDDLNPQPKRRGPQTKGQLIDIIKKQELNGIEQRDLEKFLDQKKGGEPMALADGQWVPMSRISDDMLGEIVPYDPYRAENAIVFNDGKMVMLRNHKGDVSKLRGEFENDPENIGRYNTKNMDKYKSMTQMGKDIDWVRHGLETNKKLLLNPDLKNGDREDIEKGDQGIRQMVKNQYGHLKSGEPYSRHNWKKKFRG